jgi:hypothetical protein
MATEVSTQSMTSDFSPPVCVLLVRPFLTDLSQPLEAQWECTDPESNLQSLVWSLGTSPSARDVFSQVPATSPNSTLAAEVAAVDPKWAGPVDGTWYYLTLSASNLAGLSTSFHSAPIVVDTTPPVVASVLVPSAATVLSSVSLYVSAYAPLLLAWTAGDDQSGLVAQEVCVWACEGTWCKFKEGVAEAPQGANETCVPLPRDASRAVLGSLNQTLAASGLGGVATMADAPFEATSFVVVVRVTNGALSTAFKQSAVLTAVWQVGASIKASSHCRV